MLHKLKNSFNNFAREVSLAKLLIIIFKFKNKGGTINMLNKEVVNRLIEIDLNISDILSAISLDKLNTKSYSIFLYCSQIDNLGNKDSDFDIYILYDNLYNGTKKISLNIKNIELDVEFWAESDILLLMEKLKSNYYVSDINNLKLLQRLITSNIIYNEKYGNYIKNLIDKKIIYDIALKEFKAEVISNIHDCLSFYKAQDYESAIILANYLIQSSISVLNANNGNLNLKPKWATRIFLNNGGYKQDFLERYIKYCIYPNINKDNISTYIIEILNLAEEMISESMFD
ncbi:MAG: hypothetical protein K0R54_619 [Clostridiaceae bacterium]|jgi:hypothetical protein|nr:hypothetical protein [Clostridiaceae bacterium]